MSKRMLLFAYANMALAASGQIKLFINQLPDYLSIADCAETQISTIVRNMADGCGDGSKTTSYNCFCHTSSSYFSSFIGAKVEKACATDNPDLQRTSAVALFDSYCHLGDSLTSVASSTSSSASPTSSSVSITSSAESTSLATSSSAPASPASTAHVISASASPAPSSSTAEPATDTQPPKKDNSVAIAVGTSVPIGIIAIAAAVFFVLRRNKPVATHDSANEQGHAAGPEVKEDRSISPAYTNHSEVYELMHDARPAEMDSRIIVHEMQQPANELPVRYSR